MEVSDFDGEILAPMSDLDTEGTIVEVADGDVGMDGQQIRGRCWHVRGGVETLAQDDFDRLVTNDQYIYILTTP